MEKLAPEVERYLAEKVPPRPPEIRAMEEEAERTQFPIVGPAVGHFLYGLARMTGAKKVMEMGSGYGYSLYWWAKAVGRGGKIVGTEKDPEQAERAVRTLKRLGLAGRVHIHTGDAVEILRRERNSYDIVFIDIEKSRYPLALEAALPRLKKNGLLVADNVLWFGRVLDSSGGDDESTAGIREFTRRVLADKRLETWILPMRDGVLVSRKVR